MRSPEPPLPPRYPLPGHVQLLDGPLRFLYRPRLLRGPSAGAPGGSVGDSCGASIAVYSRDSLGEGGDDAPVLPIALVGLL